MSDNRSFGEILRQAREAKNMTQATVSNRIGMSPTLYAPLEHRGKLSSLLMLAALRQVLEVDVNALLRALGERSLSPPLGNPHVVRRRGKPGLYEPFGRKLRMARMCQSRTQEAVARAVRVSIHCYHRFEQGYRLPSVPLFARIHDCLGFDANELMKLLIEPTPKEPYYHLGVMLADARLQREVTLTEAATAAGCLPERYACIENGRNAPTLPELAALHMLLQFDANIAMQRVRECRPDVFEDAQD